MDDANFKPIFDWILEGKVDPGFEHHVNPKYGRPPKDVLDPKNNY